MKKVKQLTKVLCMLLAALLLMQIATFAATPKAEREIYAKFGERSYFQGLTAWYNGTKDTIPVTAKNPDGWELRYNESRHYIYVDINDSLMYDLNGEAVEIEVDYFDKGESTFTITYEGHYDATDDSDFVDMTGVGAWKTHTFYIQDALFKNGLNGADFRIAVNSDFLKGKNSYASRANIVFGGVRVRFADKKSPVKIQLKTETHGNLFFTGEKAKFNVNLTNKLDEKLDLKAKVTALSSGKRVIFEKEEDVAFGENETLQKTYEFDIDRYGVYWLRYELYDAEGKYYSIKDAEFFYSTTTYGEHKNREGATSTHAEWFRYGEPYYTEYGPEQGPYGNFDVIADRVWKAGYGRHRIETGGGNGAGATDFIMNPRIKYQLEKWKELGLDQTVILPCAGAHPIYGGTQAFNWGTPTPIFIQTKTKHMEESIKFLEPYADSYIMGNEQDHSAYPAWQKVPASYTTWLKIAHDAIRKYDPTAEVWAYGLTMADKPWFLGTLETGSRQYMDSLSCHAYNVFQTYDEHDFVGRFEDYWGAAKEQLNIDMPSAWIGETGTFHARNGALYADESANEYVKVHLISEAHREYIRGVIDYATQQSGPESYGHLRCYRSEYYDYDLPYAPWPEYLTLSAWNNNFGGDLDPVDTEESGQHRLFHFTKTSDSSEHVVAMWGVAGTEKLVTMDLGVNEVTLWDNYGNSEKIYSDDGRYTFHLNKDIQYLTGKFTKYELDFENHKWTPSAIKISAVKDNVRKYEITAPGMDLTGFKLETEDYLSGKTLKISEEGIAGEITLASIPESDSEKYLHGLPGTSQVLYYDNRETRDAVKVSAVKDGKTYFTMWAPVKETKEVAVSAEFLPESPDNIGSWNAHFTLTNMMDTVAEGEFVIVEPNEWASSAAPVAISIAPAESKVVTIKIPDNLVGQAIATVAEIRLDNGLVIDFAETKDTMCAVYTDTPPTLDGVLSEGEWKLEARATAYDETYRSLMNDQPYTGDDDLSADISMMWDEENIYVALKVKDNVHRQDYVDGGTWKADGLQYGFVINWPAKAFTHLMSAVSNDGYVTNWVFASEDSSVEKGKHEGKFDGCVKRHEDEKITIYEMKIAWEIICPLANAVQISDGVNVNKVEALDNIRVPMKSGDTLHFGVIVNDDDNNGRKGYVEYGPDISGGTSSGFKEILLYGGKEE